MCYQKLQRARDKATGMKRYGLTDIDTRTEQVLNSTIVFGFFGEHILNRMMKMQNFSFGIGKDGGYNKTGVLTW